MENNLATFDDFAKLDVRVGTIISAQKFPEARKPAYKLEIDFGSEIGVKKSSAQITNFYESGELVGRKIIGIVNFPRKQIGRFFSEVLVLGTYSDGGVLLLSPDDRALNGDRIG